MDRIAMRRLGNSHIELAKKTLKTPVRMHLHEYYELELILSGSGEQDLNGTVYPIGPGSVYFLTPIDFHAITPVQPLEILNLSFDESMMPPELRLQLMNRRENFIFQGSSHTTQTLKSLFELLLTESRIQDSFTDKCCCALLEIALCTIVRAGPDTDALIPKAQVRQSMQYLFCHFREPITLDEVASQSGYSPNYFSKLFHESYGLRFVDFLGKLRLNYAKMLLLSTDLSVTRVAEKSGFGSPASFFRRFQQEYGISPSLFRRQSPTGG